MSAFVLFLWDSFLLKGQYQFQSHSPPIQFLSGSDLFVFRYRSFSPFVVVLILLSLTRHDTTRLHHHRPSTSTRSNQLVPVPVRVHIFCPSLPLGITTVTSQGLTPPFACFKHFQCISVIALSQGLDNSTIEYRHQTQHQITSFQASTRVAFTESTCIRESRVVTWLACEAVPPCTRLPSSFLPTATPTD